MAALIFSGCQKGIANEPNIERNLENDVVITEGDKKYEAHLTHLPEGITSVSFKSPKNLADMTFEYKNGKYIVSNKELSAEYNLNPTEKNSVFYKFVEIFNSLGNAENLKIDSKNDEILIFKINTENSEYKISTNKEGRILGAENLSGDFKVEFID